MAQIYVPIISPFSITGPLQDADDSHIQSHHVAYEIASLSHSLNALVEKYDVLVDKVTAIQVKAQTSQAKTMAQRLKKAEKIILSSQLPHEIKLLRARIKTLNSDLMILTRHN